MLSLSAFLFPSKEVFQKILTSLLFVSYIPSDPDNSVSNNLVSLPVFLDICMSDGYLSLCLLTTLD